MHKGAQHHQNVMVFESIEQRREQQGRERDRNRHQAEQRAQTHRQKNEEGRIDDDEKIIEPEIDPQPQRMHRLIAELVGDESRRGLGPAGKPGYRCAHPGYGCTACSAPLGFAMLRDTRA